MAKKELQTKREMRKLTAQLICAVVLCTVGAGLLVAGFATPPIGEIHNSVLIAFGEILTFTGAIFGVDWHYKSKNQRYGADKKGNRANQAS